MYPHHSQTTTIDATVMLFIEFPDLQYHYDTMFDSLYITDACHFRLYFFGRRDFIVSLFHPLFDLATTYIANSLQVAHTAPSVAPRVLASPRQVVPSLSLDNDEDPSEALASSYGSFSGPSDSYTPAELGMANGFLSSASD